MSIALPHTPLMKIETILDHQTIFENRRPEAFFAVRFIAPDLPAAESEPAAYCIVWDRSASIDEITFTNVRRLVSQFIRHLPPNALFSLVTFHEEAEAILDLGPVSDKSALNAIADKISQIDFGTNFSAALLLAKEQLNHAPQQIRIKKIILLTDG